MKINSLTNPHVKTVVKLRDRKERKRRGLTVIDGIREIACAKQAGVSFEEIYVCHGILSQQDNKHEAKDVLSMDVPVFEVPREVFHKISFGDRQEGLLAVCRPVLKTLDDIPVQDKPFFVVVENVEKPGNLGAILRSCDAAGVSALLVSDEEVDIFNPNVIRASLGTIFSVCVIQSDNEKIFHYLKDNKVKTIATTPGADDIYTRTDLKGPIAIVVGSEMSGLTEFWLARAHQQVKVPMKGRADSLNVSNTVAVLVFEAVRQREL